MRIMTICTGNICRSPLAEYLLRDQAAALDLTLEVASSGISAEEVGNGMDPRTLAILERLDIDGNAHRAKQFKAADFAAFDLLLALDLPHYRALRAQAPTEQDRAKVRLLRQFDPAKRDTPLERLGVYDPWYGDLSDFETTYEMIAAAIPGVLAFVAASDAPNERGKA